MGAFDKTLGIKANSVSWLILLLAMIKEGENHGQFFIFLKK